MLLDKVLPDTEKTQGCFVQVAAGDASSVGQILSIDQDAQFATLRMLATQTEDKVPVTCLRFLTRAYTCPVEDLDLKQTPNELLQIIDSNS
jgi:hypothetical protein